MSAASGWYQRPRRSIRISRAGTAVLARGSVVLLLAAMVLSACGNDDDLRSRLRDMTLQDDDMPAEFKAEEGTFSSNEALADDEAELQKLEGWDRLEGYEVTYRPETDPELPFISVTSTITIYGSEQGASESLAEGIADARKTDWEANHPGFGLLEVEEIDRPDLADEILWLRISGHPSGDPANGVVADDLLVMREGPARAFVRVAIQDEETPDRHAYLDDVEELAQAQLQRIRDVLGL